MCSQPNARMNAKLSTDGRRNQPRPAGRGGVHVRSGVPAANEAKTASLPAGAEAAAESGQAMHWHSVFLTFTTYGTWLHGDERGSYLRKGKTLREHFIAPDPALEATMRERLKGSPLVLDDAMRQAVDAAIREHCALKGWRVHALNVRTNHVHGVLNAPGVRGERVLNEIKAWATRALRTRKLVAYDQPVWTRRGSIVVLDNEAGFCAAVKYVLHGQ